MKACRLIQLFLKVVAASAPTGLARAIAALDGDPSLSMFGLMRAAGVPSGTAIRARWMFDDATTDKRLPDNVVRTVAATFEKAVEAVPELSRCLPATLDTGGKISGSAGRCGGSGTGSATTGAGSGAAAATPAKSNLGGNSGSGGSGTDGTAVLPLAEPAPEPAKPAPPPPPEPGTPARPPETRSAERLLRALLHRPRPELDVKLAASAAAISERVLEAAADRLGVQTESGQWRLPS